MEPLERREALARDLEWALSIPDPDPLWSGLILDLRQEIQKLNAALASLHNPWVASKPSKNILRKDVESLYSQGTRVPTVVQAA